MIVDDVCRRYLFHLLVLLLPLLRLQELLPVGRRPRPVRQDGGVRGEHHAALLAAEQRAGSPAGARGEEDEPLSVTFHSKKSPIFGGPPASILFPILEKV